MRLICVLIVSAACSCGCVAHHAVEYAPSAFQDGRLIDPSFDPTLAKARAEFTRMDAAPTVQPRPIVIIGGFLDIGLLRRVVAKRLGGAFRDTPIIQVSVTSCQSFAACRKRVLDAVYNACPSGDPIHSIQVDVVGLSLGGLIARDAAEPSTDPHDRRQLSIRRLFTVSSPHTGAVLAERIALWQFHRDMKPGSAFIERVNASPPNYEVYCYTHLYDNIVGEQHAAPPGMGAWWLADSSGFSAHRAALLDDRILADIALRLRGEPPLSHSPATPLPAVSD